MRPIQALKKRLCRFRGDSTGSLSVEAAIMAPALIGAVALMFSSFDMFRYETTNSKAAYTLGDLLSRETAPVNQDFIDGLKDIFDYITLSTSGTWIRVSVVRYDGDDEEFRLVWSHGSTGVAPLTNGTLSTVETHIPDMMDEDTVIVVETSMSYRMAMEFGFPNFALNNVVVTRPRFSSQLVWGS